MIRILLAAFLLISPAQAQECRPIQTVLKDALVTWTQPLEILEGKIIAAFLQTFQPEGKFDHVTHLFVMQDPSDKEIMVVGARGPCYDGHVAMPETDFHARMAFAKSRRDA